MDEAIELAIEERSSYPEEAAFIDADEPNGARRSVEPPTTVTPWCS